MDDKKRFRSTRQQLAQKTGENTNLRKRLDDLLKASVNYECEEKCGEDACKHLKVKKEPLPRLSPATEV